MPKLAERPTGFACEDRTETSTAPSDAELAVVAEAIYRARRRRERFFARDLFGEPAWDMLLDLFASRVRGARVSTMAVVHGAGMPTATGLRVVAALVERGLVSRTRATDDGRVVRIELTPQGFRLMRQCLSDSLARRELSHAEADRSGRGR